MDATDSSSSQVELDEESNAGGFKRFDGALSEFDYTACYCEENVYMLCKKLSELGLTAPNLSDLFVVFISNPIRQVPIFFQRSGKRKGGLCVWDYHVICMQRRASSVQVWDLDTTLPCPVALDVYAGSFQFWETLRPELARFYRVIAAPLYLRFFASDRRHMKNKDGSWMARPPVYDCLVAEDGAVHNLEEFINMPVERVTRNSDDAESLLMLQKFGVLLDEAGFHQFFKQDASQSTMATLTM